jgi:asparagine synthetase B (glutamine-hydrolysing)
MAALLAHRGPDDEGECVLPLAAGDVAVLAHRRLSVIDIPGGHQPLTNEDETVHLIFNGEIYNFRELRRQLEREVGILLRRHARDRVQDDPRRLSHFGRRAERKQVRRMDADAVDDGVLAQF